MQYRDSLQPGQFGDRIPIRARFSAPVQKGPGNHPASYTMILLLSAGRNGCSVALITHPHLTPRLKKEYSYTSTPPLGFRGFFYGELCLYFYFTT